MPPKSVTVYVVEDDDSIRSAIGRPLRSVGYRAVTYKSAEEFLDSIAGIGEGCLVLDIRLPEMTGLDLQEKLTSMGVKYPVIFITAHDNPHWQERAKKAGALAYLKKPFNDQILLDSIQSAWGKGP